MITWCAIVIRNLVVIIIGLGSAIYRLGRENFIDVSAIDFIFAATLEIGALQLALMFSFVQEPQTKSSLRGR